MTSVSVQDYLQTIYLLQAEDSPVSTSALAVRLGVTPASVTGMVQRLARQGRVEHTPYRGVTLTDAGEREALSVLRRQRLWELFLTEVLGMPWDQVHEEAHHLEHATSPRLEERLARHLDDPQFDPHGQFIPGRNGNLPARPGLALTETENGKEVTVLEVPGSDPEGLRTLEALGLRPGARLVVVGEDQTEGGGLLIDVEGVELLLNTDLAAKIIVDENDSTGES
jgi:DtxR family Mn-dependent transcriptional regulator